ncbi:MAG: NAD(P)H-hydrate dehydratase, partial [Pseudomonadota bacterium]|nr:NAD(P)H-hydrate dehydratase [Pseudomonadota bacterium]
AVIAWVDDASIDHDIFHPELIFTECLNLLSQGGVLVIGPGYGKTSSAIHLLSQVLDSDAVLLLDADALTLISADSRLQNALRRRQARTVLTPHPLEAARLLGCSTEAVLADRVTSAKKIAVNYGHPVVVKGAGSVIAVPSGQVWVSPWAIPLLSIPGSGDVLAGLIASFVAQKLDVEDALKLGVWVHGQSGGELQQNAGGAIGALASELTEAIRHILNRHERAG